MYKTSNPALSDAALKSAQSYDGQNVMTIQGTVNKAMMLLLLSVITASWAWSKPQAAVGFMMPALIAGFIIAMVTIFKKQWASVTAPIYAIIEGIVLGTISILFEARYPGIVMQAVALTFGTMFCLLLVYKSGLIKVTDKFRTGIVAATGAIALLYFISLIIGFFHMQMPFIYGSSPLGIGFSLIVVGIAALNLVLDFDFIESGSKQGAPHYMEWYAAFGLMITLIWLYMEILRLLTKLRSR